MTLILLKIVSQLTKYTMINQAKDEQWLKFLSSYKYANKALAPLDDVVDIHNPPDIKALSGMYKDDKKHLQSLLTKHGWKKLSGRFRNFQYRENKEISTIAIDKKTLIKLAAFQRKTALADDSLELLFEYLLDPEENLEPEKAELYEEYLEETIEPGELGYYLMKKLALRQHTLKRVEILLEHAFSSGFYAAARIKGKKTEQKREELVEAFMSSIKYSTS